MNEKHKIPKSNISQSKFYETNINHARTSYLVAITIEVWLYMCLEIILGKQNTVNVMS